MNLQQSMNKNKSKDEEGPPPSSYKFYLGSRERYIHIDCNFQSGNIQLVRQMSQFNYRLSCIDDGLKTGHRVNSKSWFYFRVHGFPKHTKGKFAISRLQTLMAVYNQHPKSYRPVYRECTLEQGKTTEWSDWSRISSECPLILRESSELECVFEFPFRTEQHCVEFAFAYPYTYSRNIEYLNGLNQYYCNDEFYFHKEVLTRSPEGRDVHLITITSHDMVNQELEEEDLFNPALFPEKCRPKRFKKPVVFISARVHPGETAASFTMEGIIDFLVNNADLRSYLLKKMFVFMIVPMINVDGVFHGHFRMDSFGKNLNRYYIDPSNDKQPAIFAIKQLANYLIKDNRLSFYFDLHAHNAKKGAFIYGNAINDFVEQVESQVFCKLFALNHSGFEYEYCNFSLKQMNSKDKNEERTKEGCGRVVMHRIANIIHSYSLQCGIISANKHSIVPSTPNEEFTLGQRGLALSKNVKPHEAEPNYFTQQSYRQLGRSLLISILDVFDKNPYNRVYNSSQKSMQFLRRVTAFEVFHTAQRFRMFEKYVYGKVKNINELIRQVLNSKLHYRELYNFYFYNDKELKNVQWPDNIPGLVKPKFTHKLKRLQSMQEPKLEYSLSFLQDLKANRDELQTFQNQQQQQQVPQLTIEDEGSFSSETQGENEKQSLNAQYMKNVIDSQMRSEIVVAEKGQSEPITSWKVEDEEESQSPWLLGLQKQICQSQRSFQEESHYPKSQKLIIREDSQRFPKVSQIMILDKVENFECEDIKLPQNESPSVRVRRLLKNEGISKKQKLTTQEMKERLNEMITNSPTITHNVDYSRSGLPQSFLTSNTLSNYSGVSAKSQTPYHDRQMKLFEEIKLEIKQELRRHKERSGIMCAVTRPPNKATKFSVSEVKPKDRIRSTNLNALNLNLHSNNGSNHKQKSQTMNRIPSRSSIGKTQLPALNSHILIITSNSSKGLVHNN